MSILSKIAAGLAITVALGAVPALADPLFTIRTADSARTLDVTADMMARVGSVTYRTILPGTDGAVHEVKGPLIQKLLDEAGIDAASYMAVALDNYEIEVPAEDFKAHGAIAAVEVDGKALTVRDKGPAWIVYPATDNPALADPLYESRSVWQLKELVAQ